MRRYELMLLLRPDLEDDKLQGAVERVTRAIVNGGGSLAKVSPWGKRRLAYEIKHFREASYFLIHFDIEPSQIRELERGMLISEEILRHLVTVIEERPPEEAEAIKATPAAAAASDEERVSTEPAERTASDEDGEAPEAATAEAEAPPEAEVDEEAEPEPAEAGA